MEERELREEVEMLKTRLPEMDGRTPGGGPSSQRARLAQVSAVVVALFVSAATAYADVIVCTPWYEFTNGTIADANQVNDNFDCLEAVRVESNDQDSRITTVETDFGAHQGDASAHHAKTTDASELTSGVLPNDRLDPGVDTNAADDVTMGSASGGDLSGTYPNPQVVNDSHTHDGRYYTESEVNALLAPLSARIAALEDLLDGVTRDVVAPDTLTFSGMNVQIVNGSGSTSNIDSPYDGLGNLIVGYNENNYSATRDGSHNLVVGMDHEYTSYAGLVAGERNTVSESHASVSGGYRNTASGEVSSVSGGAWNKATFIRSSVSGGYNNTASAVYASVSGGADNEATFNAASVSGGQYNVANDWESSVSGGRFNTADGEYSSVSGGSGNVANGDFSSVNGGSSNNALFDYSSNVGDTSGVYLDVIAIPIH